MIKARIEEELTHILKETYGVEPKGDLLTRSEQFGDYASNAALAYAKEIGKSPKEIAEEIKSALSKNDPLKEVIKNIEVAGPGFINIELTLDGLAEGVSETRDILEEGIESRSGDKIHIEFISANPTGDLHIGHGRGAFYGDALANILSFAGANVTREFYINDSRESNQIKELGKTALGKGEQYKTEKLEVLMSGMDFSGMTEEEAGFALGAKIQESNHTFIENKLGIRFDNWYSEDKNIRATEAADNMLQTLREKDAVYSHEGAEWLKTSEFGDDEDRVVLRSDGTKSYFLSDIAYHDQKFAQGYNTVIDVWGADHHGHVKRMQATKKMLGWAGELAIFIAQLVGLKEGDTRKKMSKRAGTVILLEDLVDEFGIDVVRWFFNEKALGTHMDFDAELAKKQSADNPVYYVQYAHARICSIEQKATEYKADESMLVDVLKDKEARALASKIMQFTEVVETIAREYNVHILTTYAYELAQQFSQFYRDVRVVNEDTHHSGALVLARITRETLAQALALLGISAPEAM